MTFPNTRIIALLVQCFVVVHLGLSVHQTAWHHPSKLWKQTTSFLFEVTLLQWFSVGFVAWVTFMLSPLGRTISHNSSHLFGHPFLPFAARYTKLQEQYNDAFKTMQEQKQLIAQLEEDLRSVNALSSMFRGDAEVSCPIGPSTMNLQKGSQHTSKQTFSCSVWRVPHQANMNLDKNFSSVSRLCFELQIKYLVHLRSFHNWRRERLARRRRAQSWSRELCGSWHTQVGGGVLSLKTESPSKYFVWILKINFPLQER